LAGTHGDTDTGFGDIGAATGNQLAGGDEPVDVWRGNECDVRHLSVGNPFGD
jgi:hypothetical protein